MLDGFSGTQVPADDLETLKLELLVADRDHVERRLERMTKQAKSGDTKLQKEVEQLEKLLAHLDSGKTMADWTDELPPELEPLTTKPLIAIENGPNGIDLKLEAELAELPERGGGGVPRQRRVRARRGRAPARGDARPDHVLHRGREGDARVDAAQGQTAIEAAGTIHSDIARGFIRCEVIRWDDLVAAGSHAEASRARQAAPRGQDLRRRGRRRVEHPLQRLSGAPAGSYAPANAQATSSSRRRNRSCRAGSRSASRLLSSMDVDGWYIDTYR